MSETKLINFDIISTKPTNNVILSKSLNNFDISVNEESELKNNKRKSDILPYEKNIDHIALTTSGIIDNTSVANNPKQIFNNSISNEKLNISSNNKEMLKHKLLNIGNKADSKLSTNAIISKTINDNIKLKKLEKESSTSSFKQPSKFISIDVSNNNTVLDITDTNTISNEIMTISSEDEGLIIQNANSEISETTLNQSQPPSVTSFNLDVAPTYRLSTGALEIPRSISPSSPSSPSSSSSQSSLFCSSTNHPLLAPRSYSAQALFEDTNNSSPLRNSISVYTGSNYSFSYGNFMLDDGNDNESVLAKKKKSVRFSNIVDVIESDEKNTLAKLKALDNEKEKENEINYDENQDPKRDLIFPELTTVINIEDDDHNLTAINSVSSSSSSSFIVKIEEALSLIFKYIIIAINSFLGIFKQKQNKKNRKNNNKEKNQYAIINDNSIPESEYTSLTISAEDLEEIKLNEEDNLSQSSTVGDSIAPDSISPSSLNDIKEINYTSTVSGNDKNKLFAASSLNQVFIGKDNQVGSDVELCLINSSEEKNSENDNTIENEIPERPKRIPMPLTSSSSSSSLNSISTCNSSSSTTTLISSPLTINKLSQQKSNRVVRYWYNDPKRKTMAQRFGLSKNSNNNISSNNNKRTIVLKQGVNYNKRPVLVNKISESTSATPKRSSLVNFTPTNIDINNIPNISATTTTNTILNSTTSYKSEKGQNSGFNNDNGAQIHHGKEIIIRDLNTNDEIYYALNFEDAEKGKIDLLTKNSQGKIHSSSDIPNQENFVSIENAEVTTPTSPSSISSSASLSSDKEPLRKTAKRFSHRRQNSVRLQISY